jgi:hypothetical protein
MTSRHRHRTFATGDLLDPAASNRLRMSSIVASIVDGWTDARHGSVVAIHLYFHNNMIRRKPSICSG